MPGERRRGRDREVPQRTMPPCASADGGEETRRHMEFDEYVAARGPALERYAFVLTGDAQRSQNVVQTALVKAYRRWRWVVRAGHPDAYVRRIVTTSYLDWRRRRSSEEQPVESVPDVPAAGADP